MDGGCSRAALGYTEGISMSRYNMSLVQYENLRQTLSPNHAFFNEFIFRKLFHPLNSKNVSGSHLLNQINEFISS